MVASAAMPETYRDPPATSCPLCRCEDFVEGTLVGRLSFVADDAGALRRALARGDGVRARKCARCHHLMLFAPEG